MAEPMRTSGKSAWINGDSGEVILLRILLEVAHWAGLALHLPGCDDCLLKGLEPSAGTYPPDNPEELVDAYNDLEIPKDASPEEVRQAYRLLRHRCHPDRNGSNPEARRTYLRAERAFRILCQEGKASAVDEDADATLEYEECILSEARCWEELQSRFLTGWQKKQPQPPLSSTESTPRQRTKNRTVAREASCRTTFGKVRQTNSGEPFSEFLSCRQDVVSAIRTGSLRRLGTLLLEKGLDSDLGRGSTPLHFCAFFGRLAAANLVLRNAGPSWRYLLRVQNDDGLLPADVARRFQAGTHITKRFEAWHGWAESLEEAIVRRRGQVDHCGLSLSSLLVLMVVCWGSCLVGRQLSFILAGITFSLYRVLNGAKGSWVACSLVLLVNMAFDVPALVGFPWDGMPWSYVAVLQLSCSWLAAPKHLQPLMAASGAMMFMECEGYQSSTILPNWFVLETVLLFSGVELLDTFPYQVLRLSGWASSRWFQVPLTAGSVTALAITMSTSKMFGSRLGKCWDVLCNLESAVALFCKALTGHSASPFEKNPNENLVGCFDTWERVPVGPREQELQRAQRLAEQERRIKAAESRLTSLSRQTLEGRVAAVLTAATEEAEREEHEAPEIREAEQTNGKSCRDEKERMEDQQSPENKGATRGMEDENEESKEVEGEREQALLSAREQISTTLTAASEFLKRMRSITSSSDETTHEVNEREEGLRAVIMQAERLEFGKDDEAAAGLLKQAHACIKELEEAELAAQRVENEAKRAAERMERDKKVQAQERAKRQDEEHQQREEERRQQEVEAAKREEEKKARKEEGKRHKKQEKAKVLAQRRAEKSGRAKRPPEPVADSTTPQSSKVVEVTENGANSLDNICAQRQTYETQDPGEPDSEPTLLPGHHEDKPLIPEKICKPVVLGELIEEPEKDNSLIPEKICKPVVLGELIEEPEKDKPFIPEKVCKPLVLGELIEKPEQDRPPSHRGNKLTLREDFSWVTKTNKSKLSPRSAVIGAPLFGDRESKQGEPIVAGRARVQPSSVIVRPPPPPPPPPGPPPSRRQQGPSGQQEAPAHWTMPGALPGLAPVPLSHGLADISVSRHLPTPRSSVRRPRCDGAVEAETHQAISPYYTLLNRGYLPVKVGDWLVIEYWQGSDEWEQDGWCYGHIEGDEARCGWFPQRVLNL